MIFVYDHRYNRRCNFSATLAAEVSQTAEKWPLAVITNIKYVRYLSLLFAQICIIAATIAETVAAIGCTDERTV